MKASIQWLQQQQSLEFRREYESVENHGENHTYFKFTWDGNDLLLDNSKLVRVPFSGVADLQPHFAFNSVLGIKMGWIRTDWKNDWEAGVNLQIVYHDHKVQTRDRYDFRDKNGNNPYMRHETDNFGVTWFYLSGRVSWKFANLNLAFDRAVKQPIRSLHVYSDVAGSSMVGARFTDLLKEVHYPRQGQGKVYYEPTQIHYLPVRREVIDIIEVNITENTEYVEELVKFKEDHSLVTLHFKKAADKDFNHLSTCRSL